MQASRDDFVIAIRSAFLKKENKQKFSLLALIFLTFLILVSEKFKLKPIDYLKISLREVAYRSTFIVSIPENFIKKTYIATKNHFKVYEENKINTPFDDGYGNWMSSNAIEDKKQTKFHICLLLFC